MNFIHGGRTGECVDLCDGDASAFSGKTVKVCPSEASAGTCHNDDFILMFFHLLARAFGLSLPRSMDSLRDKKAVQVSERRVESETPRRYHRHSARRAKCRPESRRDLVGQ